MTLANPTAPVSDGEGGFTTTPADLTPAEVWASIKPASARDLERVFGSVVQSSASHLVEMNYHPQVTTKTTITFGARVLSVTGVQNPDEKNVSLVLACQEVVS